MDFFFFLRLQCFALLHLEPKGYTHLKKGKIKSRFFIPALKKDEAAQGQ